MEYSPTVAALIIIGLFAAAAGAGLALAIAKERRISRKILDVMLSRIMEKEGTLPDGTPYAVLTIDGGKHWYTYTRGGYTITIGGPADPAFLARIPNLNDPMPPYGGKFNTDAVLEFFKVHRIVKAPGDDGTMRRAFYSPDGGHSWYWTTFIQDERGFWAGDTIDERADPELVASLTNEAAMMVDEASCESETVFEKPGHDA